MSTSAQNQSIENVSIPDVLNAGIPAIIQNIRAAQRRVSCDDLTARFFDNAVQSAEMLHAQLIDVYNAEADSHNSLVDAAENMQLDLGLKGKEIEELQLQIEHLKRQQQDAIDDATHDANQRASSRASWLMGSHRLKSSITSVLISFLSWTLLISSAATWAMPLISGSTNG